MGNIKLFAYLVLTLANNTVDCVFSNNTLKNETISNEDQVLRNITDIEHQISELEDELTGDESFKNITTDIEAMEEHIQAMEEKIEREKELIYEKKHHEDDFDEEIDHTHPIETDE